MSHKFILIISSLFCAALLFSCQQGQSGLNPGQFAPKIELQDLDGKRKTLADFRGKIVLLNFWATWCVPCLDEMPALERLYSNLKEQGFVVLAIGVQDSLENLHDFKTKHNLSFPILFDPTGKVQRRYLVRAFPESFIIDRKGKLVMLADPETNMPVVKLIGPKDWEAKQMSRTLNALLTKDSKAH